jgi:hypothetical protein
MISVCGVNESPIAGGGAVLGEIGRTRSCCCCSGRAGARRRGCVASDENHGEKQRA